MCCSSRPIALRPTWDEASVRERNLMLYNGIATVDDAPEPIDSLSVIHLGEHLEPMTNQDLRKLGKGVPLDVLRAVVDPSQTPATDYIYDWNTVERRAPVVGSAFDDMATGWIEIDWVSSALRQTSWICVLPMTTLPSFSRASELKLRTMPSM